MILKMKFRKCLKVFNFKLLFIFILFITGCSGPEDSFLPIKAKLINGGEFNSEEFIGMPLVIIFGIHHVLHALKNYQRWLNLIIKMSIKLNF